MSEQIDRLKQALADHYRIVRKIGAGGMATVYLLRPELAAILGAERFLREKEIAGWMNRRVGG
jgi:hypothetical protein